MSTAACFWRGLRDALPFLVVVIPFSLLFGVVATEAGLKVYETVTFSLAVIAGAAQFAALQLLIDDAPTWVALVSALTVNLRVAMYSASITPYIGAAPRWQRVLAAYFLVDQVFALAHIEYEKRPMTIPQRMAYFFGTVIPVCVPWYIGSAVGALVGKTIPDSLGLDFVLPIAFLAIIGPLLRTPAHMAAAFTGIVVSLAFAWLPYNLSLMVGGLAGMMAGARTELWLDARRAEA